MKTTLLVTALGVAGLAGCVEEPTLGTNAGISFEEYRANMAKNRESGTGAYIVDGDIALHSDEALYDYWLATQSTPQGALTIYALGGQDVKWTPAEASNITFCINQAQFGAKYATVLEAITQASTGGWEMFADVKFVHKADQDATCAVSNGNVVFDVQMVTGQPYLARAFFPNSPRGERQVLIDSTALDPATSGWPLANILGHELGHTLGFRHEHTRNASNPCFEDNDWRAITPYDSASIMHYPQCDGSSNNLAFTSMDKSGVEIVYGKPIPNLPPMVMINKPADGATVAPTFTIESSVVDDDLAKADLYIDGVFYSSKLTGPFNYDAMNLEPGMHEIKLTGYDRKNQMTTQTIHVTVEDESGCCSVGGSPASAGVLAGLTFLGLFGRRRRRA